MLKKKKQIKCFRLNYNLILYYVGDRKTVTYRGELYRVYYKD